MYDSYLEEGELLRDEMKVFFAGNISFSPHSLIASVDMLNYARLLSNNPDNDTFLAYAMAKSIGDLIHQEFGLAQCAPSEIYDAILNARPDWLYDNCGCQIESVQMNKAEFVALFGRLIPSLQRALIEAKIASGRTSRPLANIRGELARQRAYEDFLSDQAFVSLHTLGEILAMLYPVLLVSLVKPRLNRSKTLNCDFRQFIEGLCLRESVADYVDYARMMLPGKDIGSFCAQLMIDPKIILTQNDNKRDLSPYYEGIARNLYLDFMAD